MPQELLRHNPESTVVIEEMHLTMGRMRTDLGRPALDSRAFYNRLHENLDKFSQEGGSPSAEEMRFRPNVNLLLPGYYLYAMKMPQMIAYFRKRDKRSPFPQEPEEFFSRVQNPPDWAQRQLGFKRDDMLIARNVFGNLTTILDGKISLLWHFAELTEIVRTGFGVVDDPEKYKRKFGEAFRESPNLTDSFNISQAGVDSAFLSEALKFYIHPGTLELVDDLMKEEDGILTGPGEGMRPSAIMKIREEIAALAILVIRQGEINSQS